jgi:hypothetical protein
MRIAHGLVVVSSLFLASAVFSSTVDRPKPFGLFAGETREQILSDAKEARIITDASGVLVLSSAPKPSDEFRAYVLCISQSRGLSRIVAISKRIDVSDGFGTELIVHYEAMRNALADKYGAPDLDVNYLQQDSPWDGDRYQMESLLDGDRTIAASWSIKGTDTNIGLDAKAESVNVGDLVLTYVFVPEYLSWSKEHQDSPKIDNSTF